jgi:hypothetical protein
LGIYKDLKPGRTFKVVNEPETLARLAVTTIAALVDRLTGQHFMGPIFIGYHPS